MKRYQLIIVLQAVVWLVFGLFGKILPTNSRHVEIVSEILSIQQATPITQAIGIGEILIGFWILSGMARKTVTVVQILLVLSMNIVEFLLVPHLLLYGNLNLIFAVVFATLIYLNEFQWKRTKIVQHA